MNRAWGASIGDLIEPVSTWNPQRDGQGSFDYIDLSSVDQTTKAVLAASPTECSTAPSRARQLVRTDDILVSTVRPNLNAVARVTADFDGATASTGFCVLRPSAARLDPSYLFHWVRSPVFVGAMVRSATGASYPAVSDRIVKESVIPLPPLNEQRRIAAILDKADVLRQKRKRAIALLDTLTQSIFLEMFGDIIVNSRGFELGQVSDWVANFEAGKNVAPTADDDNTSLNRVLKISAVTSGIFDPYESKPLPEDYRPPRSHMVRRGDLLFSRANTTELVGATALVDCDVDHLVLPDKLWRFVWSEARQPNVLFIRHLFASPPFRHELSKRATGTSGSMKNISKAKVLSITVGQPPRSAQDAFADRVALLGRVTREATRQHTLQKLAFASLQQRAFSGQL